MTEPWCEEVDIEPAYTATLAGNFTFDPPILEDGVFRIVVHEDGGLGLNVFVPNDVTIAVEKEQ